MPYICIYYGMEYQPNETKSTIDAIWDVLASYSALILVYIMSLTCYVKDNFLFYSCTIFLTNPPKLWICYGCHSMASKSVIILIGKTWTISQRQHSKTRYKHCKFNDSNCRANIKGILVLVNDADWELLGQLEYKLEQDDTIVFISTLHGG